MNFVDQIHEFNSQAGLLEKGYNDFLESAFQLEEAMEGFNLTGLYLQVCDPAFKLALQKDTTYKASAKDTSRAIMDHLYKGPKSDLPDVERLDKACDAIVFAFGSIFKLGLNPEQAARAISIVMSANLAKLSMPKDEFGKLTKPTDFVGPEAQLQELLNERSTR